jgi:uncharacterized protein (DUF362 family)
MVVPVVKLQEPLESLRKAIELCGGFEGLGRNDKVLIKPNICLSGWMPLYGLVITTSLLEGLAQLLVQQGCHDISIGEGPGDVFGLNVRKGYKRMGIYSDSLAKWERYRSGEFDPNHFRAQCGIDRRIAMSLSHCLYCPGSHIISRYRGGRPPRNPTLRI